ncbi:PilZ domain-containing protein, partial [bacterium]|nr:PilZ domain-containing protein [bacterium]
MTNQSKKADQEHWVLKSYQEADFVLRGVPAVGFLRECWAGNVACKIHDPDRGVWQGSQICEIGATELNMELDGPDRLSLSPGRVYLVSISIGGRVHGFAVRVMGLDHCMNGGPSRVKMELPRQISSSQVRRSLRIPTSWSMDFRLEFEAGGDWVPANLLDLSLGGFRALLQDRRIRDFEHGDSLRVRLRFA